MKNNNQNVSRSSKLPEEKQPITSRSKSSTSTRTDGSTERIANTEQNTSRSTYQDGDDFKKREK